MDVVKMLGTHVQAVALILQDSDVRIAMICNCTVVDAHWKIMPGLPPITYRYVILIEKD
jgi:hypothetical protein